MKLESWHAADEKRRWKLVRLDTFETIAGEIVDADEATGECAVTRTVDGETKTEKLSFGPGGIRIIGAGR